MRAIKDEQDLTSYCLNCTAKHEVVGYILLKEVENRLMTGQSVDDNTVKSKMKEVMGHIAHVEDHMMTLKKVTQDEQALLNELATRANQIRGRIKDQNWDNLSKRSAPRGDITDIQWMRESLWNLMQVTDEGRVDFGCGDCVIETPKTKRQTPIQFPSRV